MGCALLPEVGAVSHLAVFQGSGSQPGPILFPGNIWRNFWWSGVLLASSGWRPGIPRSTYTAQDSPHDKEVPGQKC